MTVLYQPIPFLYNKVVTLTQTALLTKKLMLFGILLLILGFSSWLGYRYYYYNIYVPSLPPPEEKPDVKFGKLPKPLFPASSISASNYQYTLDTQTGDLPGKLPKIMRVYFSPQRSVGLLDPERSKDLAKKLGFPVGPEIINPTQYVYTDDKKGALSLDLESGNFIFTREDLKQATPSAIGTLSSVNKLQLDFKKYLNSKGLMREDFENGRMKVIFDAGILKNSKTATISIWPEDIDKYKIVNPLFSASLVRQIVKSGLTEKERVISMNYSYFELDKQTFATYPIKSVSAAFRDLKENKGVVILTPGTSKISLREIYLAYYQPELYTPYIQPVYVFEGENFASYVPAILSDYLESN